MAPNLSKHMSSTLKEQDSQMDRTKPHVPKTYPYPEQSKLYPKWMNENQTVSKCSMYGTFAYS